MIKFEDYQKLVEKFLNKLREDSVPARTAEDIINERAKRDARDLYESELILAKIKKEKETCQKLNIKYVGNHGASWLPEPKIF